MHGDTLLRGLPRDVSTERLTCHFGEINAIQPFREGNSRGWDGRCVLGREPDSGETGPVLHRA